MSKYSELFLDKAREPTSKYSELFLDEPTEIGPQPLVSKPWLAGAMETGEEFAYNIARDIPGFMASFPLMGMPPPLKDVAGLIGKATAPVKEKIEGLPFLGPLRDLEERAFGEKAVGEPLFEPEVAPQSMQEQIYSILKPMITGEVSVPETARGVAESTPVVGAPFRAARDPKSIIERPLPYIMDALILAGGVGALAKGRGKVGTTEAKAPEIAPGITEPVVPRSMAAPKGIMEQILGVEKPKPKKIVVGKEELALKKKLKAEGVTKKPALGVVGIPKELEHLNWKAGTKRHSASNLDEGFWDWYSRAGGKKGAAEQGIAVRKNWQGEWYAYTTKQTVKPPAPAGKGLTPYLNEKINYGGEIRSRGSVIAEMQKQGTSQKQIDAYMMGAKKFKPTPKPPAGKAAGKQPWEMSKTDYVVRELGEGADYHMPRDVHELPRKQMSQYPVGKVSLKHYDSVKKALSEGKPVPREVLAEYPELKAKPSEVSAGRAPIGGTIGVNGYFYKGGQFLPSTKAPPGTRRVNIKGKSKLVKSKKEQIAPGKWEQQPTPFSRSIYEVSGPGAHTTINQKTGKMEVIRGVRGYKGEQITPETEFRLGVRGVLAEKPYTLQELVDSYNRGARWVDVKPKAEYPELRAKAKVRPKLTKAQENSIDRTVDAIDRIEKMWASGRGGNKKAFERDYATIRTHAPKLGIEVPSVGTFFDSGRYNRVAGEVLVAIGKKYGSHPTAKARAAAGLAEYPELGKKGRKVRVTRKKAEPVELGFLGTPEAAKALGESVVGGAREISRLTSEMTEKMKVKPEIRAGVKEAKEAMIEHDRQTRRAESTSKLFEKVIKDVVPDKGRQMEMVHAYEHKMKGLHWEGLTDLEQSMVEWVAKEKAKLNKFIEKNDILEMMPESENINHIFHHWIDPKTGSPYKGMYGKFSKGLPQAKQRVIPTYESGIKKGLKPATTNIGKLVGLEWEAATRAHQSREMFKTLHQIGAEKDVTIQLVKGKRPKPIRMVERWDQLQKQGLGEGYTRYDSPFLDKAITYKTADGTLVRIKGPVGVRNEIFPFFKAYLESPNYGSLSKLNFATKSLKLGFSMFHVMSLGMQELANFRIPFKNIPRGLREVKNLGPEVRLLHQEGLELFKGYEDIGYRNKFFEGAETWKKAGNFVTKPIEAMRTFIFDIVQPGMKTSFALDKYNELLPKYLKKGLTKEQCARDVVKAADGHFSGEHYKRSLLETNRFMAKMYFSPAARKFWQGALLSPTWQREHLLVAKNVAKSFMPDRFIRKIGLSEIGPIKGEFRKYLLGATLLIGGVDLWNMYLTQKMDGKAKHLWQNPEGKGFAIRAPWNEPGYTTTDKAGKERRVKGGPGYIRPLKSVFEVAEWVKTPFKKFVYKLSPIVTATGRQFWPSKYQKEYKGWPDMPRRAWDFVTDVGTPISASQIGSWAMGKKTLQAAVVPFFGAPTSKLSIKQTNKVYYERLAAIQKKHGRYSDQWKKVKTEFESMGYKFIEKTYQAYREEKKQPAKGILGVLGIP